MLIAAERLEQGEELSKLKAERRWIPVTEKLPKSVQKVLIVDKFGSIDIARYIGDGTWLFETCTRHTSYIRHWMPLPEPPKEE